ncbi:hypothetical protein WN48_05769 [Eufriesea mexicana]|uniref:Uncharacterized protein n=1 Tax=Eufriesea mexicana TaxID=516756 RepID=A0A310SDL5_9HYME|nr:hypothetical protein WN48_05769 [Eufriesea mexicana]
MYIHTDIYHSWCIKFFFREHVLDFDLISKNSLAFDRKRVIVEDGKDKLTVLF